MRLPQLDQWEAVRVEWSDSSGPGEAGWQKIGKKQQEIHGMVTVGQVFAQSSDRLTLCFSWDPVAKHTDGFITIPLVAVSGVERLRCSSH